jgi:hypothetical protein
MKKVTIDIDKLDDYISLVRLASQVSYVDVQDLTHDVLFMIGLSGNVPIVYQHCTTQNKWREKWPEGMPVFEATLELE